MILPKKVYDKFLRSVKCKSRPPKNFTNTEAFSATHRVQTHFTLCGRGKKNKMLLKILLTLLFHKILVC